MKKRKLKIKKLTDAEYNGLVSTCWQTANRSLPDTDDEEEQIRCGNIPRKLTFLIVFIRWFGDYVNSLVFLASVVISFSMFLQYGQFIGTGLVLLWFGSADLFVKVIFLKRYINDVGS